MNSASLRTWDLQRQEDAGKEVGDIFRAGRAYDVVVLSPEWVRHSFSDIANLPIDTPSDGNAVAL
jgi:Cu/Ag efflux pump CusA